MDFVLVHGTTQGPGCWDRLIRLLVDAGHRAQAVDLPVGQPDLLADDYARIAAGQVAARDPVVVAHSGGGLILPALARRLGARHLVWLAAAVPDFAGGRSMVAQIEAESDAMYQPECAEWTLGDPVDSAYFLFHSCDLATLRWAMGTLRPWQPRAVFGEPPGPAPDVASTYVLPRGDRVVRPEWMRVAATRRLGATPLEIDGDHCPHVHDPALVAAILTGV